MSHCLNCFNEESKVIGYHVDWTKGFNEGHIRHECTKCGVSWCETDEEYKRLEKYLGVNKK